MNAAAIREFVLSKTWWHTEEFFQGLEKDRERLAQCLRKVLAEPVDTSENLEYNLSMTYRLGGGRGPVHLWIAYLCADWPKHSGWYAEPCKFSKDQPDCRLHPADQDGAVVVMRTLALRGMWAPFTYYGARQHELAQFLLEKLENGKLQ